MVLNKDKVRQSIFDVVPRAAKEAKAREEEARKKLLERSTEPAPTAPGASATPPAPAPAEPPDPGGTEADLFGASSGDVDEAAPVYQAPAYQAPVAAPRVPAAAARVIDPEETMNAVLPEPEPEPVVVAPVAVTPVATPPVAATPVAESTPLTGETLPDPMPPQVSEEVSAAPVEAKPEPKLEPVVALRDAPAPAAVPEQPAAWWEPILTRPPIAPTPVAVTPAAPPVVEVAPPPPVMEAAAAMEAAPPPAEPVVEVARPPDAAVPVAEVAPPTPAPAIVAPSAPARVLDPEDTITGIVLPGTGALEAAPAPRVTSSRDAFEEKASGLIGEVERTPRPLDAPVTMYRDASATTAIVPPVAAASPEPAAPVEAVGTPITSPLADEPVVAAAVVEALGAESPASAAPVAEAAEVEAVAETLVPPIAEPVPEPVALAPATVASPPAEEPAALESAPVEDDTSTRDEARAEAFDQSVAEDREIANETQPAAGEPAIDIELASDDSLSAPLLGEPAAPSEDPGGDAWRGVRWSKDAEGKPKVEEPPLDKAPPLPPRETPGTARIARPNRAPETPPAAEEVEDDSPMITGMVGERPPPVLPPEPHFLELDPAGTAYAETPVGFAHVIRKYLTGDFFAQFIRLFIVCKMCQHRLESTGNFLSCPGCKHRIDSKDLAVHVLRFVGEELYARERVTKELEWLEAPKLNLRGTVKKNVGEDIARVLSEAYICMFAHELVKTAVHKSPGTLLEFFRKYIDRIEIGKGDIKIHIR